LKVLLSRQNPLLSPFLPCCFAFRDPTKLRIESILTTKLAKQTAHMRLCLDRTGSLGRNMAKTILIVDDAMFMRTMVRNILLVEGYAVYEASNGQEAIQMYELHSPQLVFMDITMPVMDGIAATKAIKEKSPNAMIVMCSAMGQQNMVIEAVKAGAKDFIVKPFQADRVLECVKKFVA